MPRSPSEAYRKSKKKSLDVDVLARRDLWKYLRDWAEAIRDIDDDEDMNDPPPKRAAARSASLRSNATAIITITRSLAIQLDAKLEELRRQKPNSPDAIAARNAAISDYEKLRARVADLETAVAKLRRTNSNTTPAEKAGSNFGKTVEKWWAKSGPKLLDKGADMGIVVTCAGILGLMGVDLTWAAAVSAYVVTGKAPKGLFKAR